MAAPAAPDQVQQITQSHSFPHATYMFEMLRLSSQEHSRASRMRYCVDLTKATSFSHKRTDFQKCLSQKKMNYYERLLFFFKDFSSKNQFTGNNIHILKVILASS